MAISLNSLLRKTIKASVYIAQLWHYADTWHATQHPMYMRNALRCKTMALIYEDRNAVHLKG